VGRAAAVHRARLPVGLALLLALGLPSPACGQVYLGLDAALTSPYVWRGVTRANGWVVQPECFTSVRTGDGFLSGGAWASYETPPRQPRRPVGSRPWPARARRAGLLGQASWSLGLMQAELGAIRYTFRGTAPTAGRTRVDNTTELYMDVRAVSKYIVPGVALWLDVDRVGGAYIEGSATVPLLANPLAAPFIALITRAALGYTLGQEVNVRDPAQGAYFARAGVTHVDFAMSGDLSLHPVGVATVLRIEGHTQFSADPATRPTTADPSDARRSVKLWAALALRLTPAIVSW